MKGLTSPTKLIRQSLQIFFEKNNLVYFLKVYSILIPFTLITTLQRYFIKTSYPLIFVVDLAYILFSFFIGVAGIYAVMAVVSGNRLTIKETYSVAAKNIWKYALLSFLIFLITFGGILLLIIPGIIFSIWFTFSRYILLEKNIGISKALTESKALVKGRFWKIFGRLFVFGFFFISIQIASAFIPFGIGSVFASLFGALFILPSYLLFKELERLVF